jgi:carbon storage regulator CsrA
MLVLHRKVGQAFVIGKNAEITIKILGEIEGAIRIGIDAPKAINVDRLEVYRKRQESEASGLSEELPQNQESSHVRA